MQKLKLVKKENIYEVILNDKIAELHQDIDGYWYTVFYSSKVYSSWILKEMTNALDKLDTLNKEIKEIANRHSEEITRKDIENLFQSLIKARMQI